MSTRVEYEWVVEWMDAPDHESDIVDPEHWPTASHAIWRARQAGPNQPTRIGLIRYEVEYHNGEAMTEIERDYAYFWSSWGGYAPQAETEGCGHKITKRHAAEAKKYLA